MKEKILQLLRQQKGFISGQQLCEQLEVSRTAVWKVINQLRKEGYEIQAVQNKGYCLMEAPDKVTVAEVQYALKTGWLGCKLSCLKTVDSTNLEAKRLADANAPEGTLVIADKQEMGRGRRGRAWASPAGSGLWMSFVLRPEYSPAHASMITLIVAMAVRQGIADCTGIKTAIKWPNDVIYEGRKICGILTEMNMEDNRISHIVVGIGINANIEMFPEELREKAISLKMILGHSVKRAELANAVLCAFEEFYERFCVCENLSFMQEEYNHYLVHMNQPVRIVEGNNMREAVARGINAQGGLIVEHINGEMETIYSGEISVRGIYGYV